MEAQASPRPGRCQSGSSAPAHKRPARVAGMGGEVSVWGPRGAASTPTPFLPTCTHFASERPAFDQVTTMSKFLLLGMPLAHPSRSSDTVFVNAPQLRALVSFAIIRNERHLLVANVSRSGRNRFMPCSADMSQIVSQYRTPVDPGS
jgi:hypothetical protein